MVRERVAAFPYPPHGRIPNFVGAEAAAKQIRKLDEYGRAECVFSPPDGVLIPFRRMVLKDGKILAYSTPHMKRFKMMKPGAPIRAAIRDLVRSGEPLTRSVDIAVVGSVAVDMRGNRIGKGSGYGDRELAYLKKRNPLVRNPCSLQAGFRRPLTPSGEPRHSRRLHTNRKGTHSSFFVKHAGRVLKGVPLGAVFEFLVDDGFFQVGLCVF